MQHPRKGGGTVRVASQEASLRQHSGRRSLLRHSSYGPISIMWIVPPLWISWRMGNNESQTGELQFQSNAAEGTSVPIFEVANDTLIAADLTSYGAEGLHERQHIQQLLRKHITVLEDRLLVIAEEFGDWLDSSRRIDLLCLDADANLVVVELKRTENGGHMDLQALRYAAMVSTMTVSQLIDVYARTLDRSQPDLEAAKTVIQEFLGGDEIDESQFNRDTRIILASADFGKEITTTVLWLIDQGLDIKCVRLKPYRLKDGKVLLDIQQLIPLPEAATFQTQIGVKRQTERLRRSERHEQRFQFWEQLLNYAKGKTKIHANRSPTNGSWIAGSTGRAGFALNYVVRQLECQVELWIGMGAGKRDSNKAAFRALFVQRDLIENEFGEPLDWQELPESDGSRIRFVMPGGYRSPTDEWPAIHAAMTDAMIRLDKTLRSRVNAISGS